MADIVAELGTLGVVGVRTFEAEVSAGEGQEACHLAQQAGLARAVRAANQQCLAGRKAKAHVAEDDPAAALAGDVTSGEADHLRHLLENCAI
jgi:hypothetical protein